MDPHNTLTGLFIGLAEKEDLLPIIELQKVNLGRNLSDTEKAEQGFVSVETSLDLLTRINSQSGIIVARINNTVIGYIIRMTDADTDTIPLLKPFTARFPTITFEGKSLTEYRYCILGQVCIQKEYRGQGLLEKLYTEFRNQSAEKYDLAISEIGTSNPRSLHVHTTKIGFKVAQEYSAEERNWYIVILDLRSNI